MLCIEALRRVRWTEVGATLKDLRAAHCFVHFSRMRGDALTPIRSCDWPLHLFYGEAKMMKALPKLAGRVIIGRFVVD